MKGLLFQEACPDPAPAALVTAYLSICSLDSGRLAGRAYMPSFSVSRVPTRAWHIAGAGEFCQITGPPDTTPPCDGSYRSENWVIFSPVPRFNSPSCTPRIGRTRSVTLATEEAPTEFSDPAGHCLRESAPWRGAAQELVEIQALGPPANSHSGHWRRVLASAFITSSPRRV